MNKKDTKKKQTSKPKQWRHNIDVTQEEKNRIEKLEKIMKESNVDKVANDFTYEINVKPEAKDQIGKGFLNRKTEIKDNDRIEKEFNKKLKKYEANSDFNKSTNPVSTNKDSNDLWEDDKVNSKSQLSHISLSKVHDVKYPKVVLSHPGLSYNPKKEDTKNLLGQIVDMNKDILITKEFEENRLKYKETKKAADLPLKEEKEAFEEESDESDEEEDSEDEDNENGDGKKKQKRPLTKAQRNKKIRTKLNKLDERKAIMKKETKNEISKIISNQRFSNIQKENAIKIAKEERRKKKEEEKVQELMRLGHVDE